MKVYEKEIKVTADDLDDLKHVNNVRYVQWIQDISKEHWVFVTPDELSQNIFWVVRNHTINYKNSAVLGDLINVRTYIKETKGALSVRSVEMFNQKTNQLLVSALTEWCLLSADTLKPLRVSQEIVKMFS